MDPVEGVFSSEGFSGVLESITPGEHVEGFLGEGSALAENSGLDVSQSIEALPEGLGDP